MKGNHEIDGFVRRKLAEREFAFEGAFWEEAEKLLDEQQIGQRKPRRGLWFFFFLLTGVSMLGVYGLGTWLTKTPTPQIGQTAASAQGKSTLNEAQTSLSQENSTEEPIIPKTTPQIAQLNSYVVPTAPSKAVLTSTSRGGVTVASHSISAKTETSIPAQTKHSNILSNPKNTLSLSPYLPKNNSSPAYDSSPTLSTELASTTLHNYEVSTIDFLPSRLNVSLEPQTDLRPIKRYRIRHRIFAEVGSSINSQAAFAPYVGLIYQHRLSARLQVETGFRYRVQTGIGFDEQIRREIYSFGYIVEDYRAEIDRLHYVEMPLRLRFRLSARHSFTSGLSAGYLVYSEGALFKTRTTSISAETESNSSFNNFLAPFSTTQWQGEIGYTYHLHPKFSLGAQARYRFNNLYETDNMSKWQLGLKLRYHLLSK